MLCYEYTLSHIIVNDLELLRYEYTLSHVIVNDLELLCYEYTSHIIVHDLELLRYEYTFSHIIVHDILTFIEILLCYDSGFLFLELRGRILIIIIQIM
jgi:hypothetical protein